MFRNRYAWLFVSVLAVAALCFLTADAFAATSSVMNSGIDFPQLAMASIAAGGVLMRKDTTQTPEQAQAEVAKELKRIADEVKQFGETAMKEVKKTGDMTTETKAKVDELITTKTELTARLTELEQKMTRRGNTEHVAVESPGQVLEKSDALKQFVANKTRGVISIPIPNASIKTMFSTDVAPVQPGVLQPQLLPGILARLRQRLFIRDLISPGRTGAPSVAYVRQTGFTSGADVVSEGETKPSSSITFDTKIAQVTTIAHIFKAAKQLLDDFPALQSTIDDELRYGLAYAEEREILFGDGTGIHLDGIVTQATAYSAAFAVNHHNRIDVLRLAILQAELAELPASGIVLHPTDWAAIELTKTQVGEYLWANPMNLAGPRLWGLPVVPTKAMDAGDFLTGGFQGGAQVFDREDANVVIATQNEDDFVRNLITVRAEERLALVVKRPEAFITGTFPEDSE
jgi:HK97 family phage major capsid protein